MSIYGKGKIALGQVKQREPEVAVALQTLGYGLEFRQGLR